MSKAQTKIVQDAGINEAIIAPLKPDMKYIAMMAPKEATISGTQNMPRGQQLCYQISIRNYLACQIFNSTQ